MDSNGHPAVTQFIVKLTNEIGYGGPFSQDETRAEILRYGRRGEGDLAFSNVEWIREWDGASPGRERSISEFIDD